MRKICREIGKSKTLAYLVFLQNNFPLSVVMRLFSSFTMMLSFED